MLEYIGDGGPLEYGTKVIFGVGKNNNSLKRYEYLAKEAKTGISVLPVLENSIEPINMDSGAPYKSSDVRKILDEGGDADLFFGHGRTETVRSMLGFDSPIEEMSGAGGGGVAGYGAPLSTKPKKKKHNEYNELYLYKEVLKLFKNKGIIK